MLLLCQPLLVVCVYSRTEHLDFGGFDSAGSQFLGLELLGPWGVSRREIDSEILTDTAVSSQTKTLDLRAFDSSRVLMLRGYNS